MQELKILSWLEAQTWEVCGTLPLSIFLQLMGQLSKPFLFLHWGPLMDCIGVDHLYLQKRMSFSTLRYVVDGIYFCMQI